MATWEIRIHRQSVQDNGSQKRTVGTYQVYHDDGPVAELSGTTAESPGPGQNDHPATREHPSRIRPGRYPLWTQDGEHYATIGYGSDSVSPVPIMPGIELRGTGGRTEILIHPGKNEFLSSIGCINLCTRLPDAGERIDFPGSRRRVIALIEDMKTFLGQAFPTGNGKPIPGAWAVIDGEP